MRIPNKKWNSDSENLRDRVIEILRNHFSEREIIVNNQELDYNRLQISNSTDFASLNTNNQSEVNVIKQLFSKNYFIIRFINSLIFEKCKRKSNIISHEGSPVVTFYLKICYCLCANQDFKVLVKCTSLFWCFCIRLNPVHLTEKLSLTSGERSPKNYGD